MSIQRVYKVRIYGRSNNGSLELTDSYEATDEYACLSGARASIETHHAADAVAIDRSSDGSSFMQVIGRYRQAG